MDYMKPETKMIKFEGILILLIYLVSITMANAQEPQSLDDIVNQAKTFIEKDLRIDSDSMQVTIKPLDRRLKLHACTLPLNAFWPPGAQKSAHTSIGVSCNDEKPWKIYVGAYIQQFSEVWVTTTALSRGTAIKPEHIVLERKDMSSSFSQFMGEQHNPVGLIAKRPMRAGDVLYMSALDKQIAIKRGQKVQVIATRNGLEIRSSATAMTDGSTGERIRVMNTNTKKELEGVLDENNIVRVNI